MRYLLSLLLLTTFSLEGYARSSKATLLNCFHVEQNAVGGISYSRTPEVVRSIEKRREELKGLNYVGIIPWRPKKRDAVKRFITNQTGTDLFMVSRPPVFNRAQKLGEEIIDVKDIKWSQHQAANMSQDGKYSVIGNAHAIKEGKLDVTVLPTIKVWRDTQGRVWTLDHRRLAAIKLAGNIKKIKVEFVGEDIVTAQKSKFSTLNEGEKIFIHLDEKGADGHLTVVVD